MAEEATPGTKLAPNTPNMANMFHGNVDAGSFALHAKVASKGRSATKPNEV